MKKEPTRKEQLIEIFETEICNCTDEDIDAASWNYEEGILISKRTAMGTLDALKSNPKIKKLERDRKNY